MLFWTSVLYKWCVNISLSVLCWLELKLFSGKPQTSVIAGLCSLTACSLYAHKIMSEFYDPLFVDQKYAPDHLTWNGRNVVT